mmetsp:Transcript_9888/g.14578  ORF Transcript_9888/g.14578 Transcript_9888/m.14578 type:complete len:231 (-) Transcript_9888:951-1643(-)
MLMSSIVIRRSVICPWRQRIIQYKIVSRVPSLVQIPVQSPWIGILVDNQVVIVGRFVVNIVTTPVNVFRRRLGGRQWIRYPSLLQSPQKVPLGKDTALHFEIPKQPPFRNATIPTLVRHHLSLHEFREKLFARSGQTPVQKRRNPVGRHVPYHHGRERRRQLVVRTTPFSHHAFHADASGNRVVIVIQQPVLVTAALNVLRIVTTHVSNVLTGCKGPTLFKKNVVRMTVQ